MEQLVVSFEFLDREPIENVITCMHYPVDKVVFFGYHHMIEQMKERTTDFLKEICHVSQVQFCEVSETDLQATTQIMREVIDSHKEHLRMIDITGGEDLILVAFGILSREFDVSMHMYDVIQDQLIELTDSTDGKISERLVERRIALGIDTFVKMQGGVVNMGLHKGIKTITSPEQKQDVERLYDVASSHWEFWNPFSNVIKNLMADGDFLRVTRPAQEIRNLLSHKFKLKDLNSLLGDMLDKQLLQNYTSQNGFYTIEFKNKMIRDMVRDGGSILELHTYLQEAPISDECRIGVHLDWDGIIHSGEAPDVVNEIDVFAIKGNVPTFISCKTGKMDASQALHALYELETVTDRFGGKYAKKMLVTVNELGITSMQRAKEMGISVRVVGTK